MSSFLNLYEASQRPGGDFWFKPESDEEGTKVIQRGLEIRADRTDGNSFWDDMISIFGQNSEEIARLLEVPQDKVAKWPGKIKKLLDMVRKENENEEGKKRKKTTMLPTGTK